MVDSQRRRRCTGGASSGLAPLGPLAPRSPPAKTPGVQRLLLGRSGKFTKACFSSAGQSKVLKVDVSFRLRRPVAPRSGGVPRHRHEWAGPEGRSSRSRFTRARAGWWIAAQKRGATRSCRRTAFSSAVESDWRACSSFIASSPLNSTNSPDFPVSRRGECGRTEVDAVNRGHALAGEADDQSASPTRAKRKKPAYASPGCGWTKLRCRRGSGARAIGRSPKTGGREAA